MPATRSFLPFFLARNLNATRNTFHNVQYHATPKGTTSWHVYFVVSLPVSTFVSKVLAFQYICWKTITFKVVFHNFDVTFMCLLPKYEVLPHWTLAVFLTCLTQLNCAQLHGFWQNVATTLWLLSQNCWVGGYPSNVMRFHQAPLLLGLQFIRDQYQHMSLVDYGGGTKFIFTEK